jgi:chloride channel protein, CIC family
MAPTKPEHGELVSETPGLARACVVAVVAGLLIGVVGAGFRAGLAWVGPRHVAFVEWAHGWPWIGWLAPVVLGAAGAGLARLLVRRQPLAAGSGVQHLEAIMRHEAFPAPIWVVPVKFAGGLLAIGTGLALGREGPTIQMGATIGAWLATRCRCAAGVLRDMQAALGGAGLAVAFNAPVGGSLFVFEEVARGFRLRLTILTLLASASAIAVARWLLGDAPDFRVAPLPAEGPGTLPFYLVFGCVLGLLGVLYNRLVTGLISAVGRLGRWPSEVRAGLIGALVGLVAWFSPSLVGGGDNLSQAVLDGGLPVTTVLVIVLVRWFLGPLSYSAGTPGGLFSPLLLVGAALGALFVAVANTLLPTALSPVAFAVIGMSAFFTGVVRAPLTGIVLIIEMTAISNLMVPMLVASGGAMLTASLLRGEPIYDTLRHHMLENRQPVDDKNT